MTLTWTAVEQLTGRFITNLPLLDVKEISRVIGRYDTATGILPMPHAPADWQEGTMPGFAALVLLDGEMPVWGGRVTYREAASADAISLTLATAEEYLDRRIVGDISFPGGVGQNVIVATIVQRFAADGAVPGMPIRVEFLGGDGPLLYDQVWARADNKTIYSVLTDLSGQDGGPEWTMVWERTAIGFGVVLRVGSRIGVAQAEPAIRFSAPGNVLDFTFSEDYRAGKGANRVTATSSGQGAGRPSSSPQVAGEDGRPTYELEYTATSSVKDLDQLAASARSALAALSSGTSALSLVLAADAKPTIDVDWSLGDDVGYDITAPSAGHLTGVARVIGWTRTLTGTRTVTPVLRLPSVPIQTWSNTRLSTINWKSAAFPNWRAARARASTGDGRAHVTTFVDSITAGAGTSYPQNTHSWAGRLRDSLGVRMGATGTGLIPVADAAALDDRISAPGATWLPSGGVMNLGQMVLTGTAYMLLAPTWCDAVDLWVVATAGSTARIRIDGVDVGLLDVSGDLRHQTPGAFPAKHIAYENLLRISMKLGITSDLHFVQIEPATPTDVVKPVMIETYLWAMPGVRVSNMARGGASMVNMVSDSVDGTAGMAITINGAKPDLMILMPGMNDYQGHVTLADFRARMVTAITRQRAAGGDVLLVSPPQPNYDLIPGDHLLDPPLSAYRDVLLELVTTYDLPLVDIFTRWGEWLTWASKGWNSDAVHLSDAGAIELASVVQAALDTI